MKPSKYRSSLVTCPTGNGNSNGGVRLQTVSSRTPPFRTGGRGCKQLSKAINDENDSFVFCQAKDCYYGKVISIPSGDNDSVLVQPMHQSVHDSSLFTPWEGQIWLANSKNLTNIQVGRRILKHVSISK